MAKAKMSASSSSAPKSAEAKHLGAKGGKKGGPARAQSLTPEERKAIAKKGAEGKKASARKK